MFMAGGVFNLQAMMLMLTIFLLFTMFIDVHTLIKGGCEYHL